MPNEIASAFVRIRPNMTGFKGETEAGVKSGFRDIAKIAGIAFGAAQAFEFGKSIIEHAANVQKQVEGVKDGFGDASEAVLKFSEGGAAKLGISAHAAETTANRFAILFRQIGIGPKLAGEMTINFEKLAGSIAQIRGIKPEDVLRNLPLALAGNVRSLKQLGIAVDASSLKVAAFKAGITNSVTQALTPGQRALAIYAVATAHLGEFQAQAAKHAGDLYNKDLRLSAEWDNAKDRLGKGLLPAMAALTGFLSRVLPPAVDATIAGFRLLGQTIGDVAGAIAPALKPVEDLIAGVRKSLDDGLGGGPDVSQINQRLSSIGKGVDVASNLAAVKRQLAGVAAGTDLTDVNKRLGEIGKGVDVSANVAAIRRQLGGLDAAGPVERMRKQVASLADSTKDAGKRTIFARIADELKTLTPSSVGTLSLLKQQVADLSKASVDSTVLQKIRRQVADLAGADVGGLRRRLSEVGKGIDVGLINRRLSEIGKGVDVGENLRAVKRQFAGLTGADVAGINKRLAAIGRGVDVTANVAAIRRQLSGLAGSDFAAAVNRRLGEVGKGADLSAIRRELDGLAAGPNVDEIRRRLDELGKGTNVAANLRGIRQLLDGLGDGANVREINRQVAALGRGDASAALDRIRQQVAGLRPPDVRAINARLAEVAKGVDVSGNVAAIRRQLESLAVDPSTVREINRRLADVGRGVDVSANVSAIRRQLEPLAPDLGLLRRRLSEIGKGVDVSANVAAIRRQLAGLGAGAGVEQINRRLGEIGKGVDVAGNLRAIRDELDGLGGRGGVAAAINRQLGEIGRGVDVGGNLRAVKRELAGLGDTPAVRRIRQQLDGLGKGVDTAGVKKLREELDRYSSSKLERVVAGVKKAWQGLSPASKVAAVAIGAVAASLAVAAAAAFPITAAIAAVGGLAIGFQLAKEHSARFRAVMGDVSDFAHTKVGPALKGIAAAAGPAFAQLAPTARAALDAVRSAFTDVVAAARAIWTRFGGTIATIARTQFGGVVRVVKDALQTLEGVFKVIGGVLSGDWGKALGGLREIAKSALDGLLAPFETFGKNVVTLFEGIWQNVERVTLVGLAKFTALLAKVPTKFKALGVTVGIDNPFKAVTEGLKAKVAKLDAAKEAKEVADALAASAKKALEAKTRDPGIAEAAGAVADNTKKVLHAKLKDATSKGVGDGVKAGADEGVKKARAALDAAKTALSEAITQRGRDVADAVAQSKQNLITIGQSLSTSIAAVIDEPYRKAGEHLGLARARLALEFDRASAPLEAQARRLSRLQQQLSAVGDRQTLRNLRSSVLLPGGKPLAAGQSGLKELQALAKGSSQQNRAPIDAFILQYRGALLQVQSDKVGLKQSALDARRQTRETALNLRGDALSVGQGVSTLLQETTTRAISDMTVALNTGELRIGGFYKRLADLLAHAHVNVKRAQKLLGTAFADLLKGQTEGIGAQAAANAAGPQRAGSGQAPTIVHPLWVMQKDTAKIARLQEQVGNRQIALQTKIEKNTKKAADQAEKLAGVNLGPTSKGLGKQSRTSRDLSEAAAG